MRNLQPLLDDLVDSMRGRTDRGTVAHYIPQLSHIDPNKFGIAVACTDGRVFASGDADERFSIQSISKVFTLTIALGKVGDALWDRVGREPSGNRFNSIVQLEHENGKPRNPFINAGAIVVSDILLAGHEPRETIGEILRFVQSLANDDSILIDPAVADGERKTGFRNIALANYMRDFENLKEAPERTLGVYFHQCAIAMSCRQLAAAGLYLANNGVNPATGYSVISPVRARRVNALMLTCGHYDGSGDFAFRVGLPGKSGVGGGILAVVPGLASIAVWSPGLNQDGNSRLGSLALERLAHEMDWSIF
jgi:glutaminase